jgi:hypothetical protein
MTSLPMTPLPMSSLPMSSLPMSSLPLRAITLISQYSKPLTRPNWKTNPTFTFTMFYKALLKKQKCNTINNVLHFHIYNNHTYRTISLTFINNASYLKNDEITYKIVSEMLKIDISQLKVIIKSRL